MGSEWDLNGIRMGSEWDHDGIQTLDLLWLADNRTGFESHSVVQVLAVLGEDCTSVSHATYLATAD